MATCNDQLNSRCLFLADNSTNNIFEEDSKFATQYAIYKESSHSVTTRRRCKSGKHLGKSAFNVQKWPILAHTPRTPTRQKQGGLKLNILPQRKRDKLLGPLSSLAMHDACYLSYIGYLLLLVKIFHYLADLLPTTTT